LINISVILQQGGISALYHLIYRLRHEGEHDVEIFALFLEQ
jgi:hypothetical protein